MRIGKYLDNISSLQFFQLLRYGSQLLIAILLVKLNFSQFEIGQYETFLLISGFFSFFWVSGIINALLSLFKEKTTGGIGVLIFNVFILLCAINLLIVGVLYVGANYVGHFTKDADGSSYLNYILIFLLLNNPGFIIEYIYLMFDRPKAIIRYGAIIFLVMILCTAIPILLQMGVQGVFMGMIIFAGIKFVWLLVVLYQYAEFKFQSHQIRELLIVGIPIVVSIFLSGSAEYIDGWIVKYYYDDAGFSIFRYGARELPVVVLIANAFSVATIPLVAQNFKDGMFKIKSRSAKMMHWLFPITIVLMLSSNFLFTNIFSESFVQSAHIFNIYLLLIVSRLIFPQTILTGMKKTTFLTISSGIELIINVILSIILIHRFGLAGVAYATFVAFAFDKLFLILINYKLFKIKPADYIPIKVYLPYLVITMAVYCYLQY